MQTLRTIACMVCVAGANSINHINDIPILLNTMDVGATKQHMTHLQGIQTGLMESKDELLQMLQSGTEKFDMAMKAIDKGAEFVGAAVKWIDESSDKAADVQRITETLNVVRDNRVTLVQYSEEMLHKSIQALAMSAHQVYGAMQQVKSMAVIVKSQSQDTLDILDDIQYLDGDQDRQDHWRVAIGTLVHVLNLAHERTGQIHSALDETLNTMVKMRAAVDSMVERTTINIQAEQARLADELAEAERKLASYSGGCFGSVGEGFKTIFSLGMSCLAREATVRKIQKMKDQVQKSHDDYGRSIGPLVGKLAGMGDAARALLDASYQKFENIGDFLSALAKAKTYFSSPQAQRIDPRAQLRHVAKLNELIEACDIMMYNAVNNMEVFKAINTGSTSMEKDFSQIKADQVKETEAYKAKVEAEEQAAYDRDVKKLEAQLAEMKKNGSIKGMQLIDLRLLKEGIVQGPQFMI